MSDELGGFENVREEVDGHPMLGLLRYAKSYWKRLTVGVLTSLVTRVARLVPPLIVAAAVDRVITGSGKPGLLAELGLLTSDPLVTDAARIALLRRLALIAAVAYVVRSITRFLSRYLLQSTAQKIQRDLRNDTYDHMQRLSLDFFSRHQTGAMMSILNNDINRLERFLNDELRQIIRVVATVGGIGVVLFYVSPPLAVIALAPVPIIGVSSVYFLTWIEPKYKRIRETVARLNSRLENNIGGAKVIKAFDRYDFELDRVADQSETYHDEKVAAIRLRRAFFATIRVLTGVAFVGILLVGGEMVIRGEFRAGPVAIASTITAGTFTMFFLYLRRLYAPMRRIGVTANRYQRAKSSAERVFGVLGHEPTVTSPENPTHREDVEGHVEFDDVRFSYDTTEEILSGVSLDVSPGETVGLAGETGAGKSTLVKLVPRFYDVDSGAVRVDGTDVREYDLQGLREHIGVVEQNPYLFSGTVAENIAYGDLTALGGDDVDQRIVDAAKAAEAHGFIRELPDGYDTQIGERGVKLSGGQRQRLSIARALLNDPAIIVLDEATSDVDTETEELIQESLRTLIEDRTAFVIAHRLSTIKDADRIVVMDDGGIAEMGTHDALTSDGGMYASLWETQADASANALDD
ncbi:ABC transporter ATP-binding protein [Salarchaeum sp. JOR-1]|uniref:ABC transporter ATP-binding protein n=1 Tax=Salarchaeum sp. JOR-1 TaxID=2599399 RepID=UPI001198A3BA|nr:ABC transporter ATP-binding protein [Salarchaeum sp. JOR-1]QDX40638.1 ABC transporter ATP-binding protein [Salarchaeum sp. JOR-1]